MAPGGVKRQTQQHRPPVPASEPCSSTLWGSHGGQCSWSCTTSSLHMQSPGSSRGKRSHDIMATAANQVAYPRSLLDQGTVETQNTSAALGLTNRNLSASAGKIQVARWLPHGKSYRSRSRQLSYCCPLSLLVDTHLV